MSETPKTLSGQVREQIAAIPEHKRKKKDRSVVIGVAIIVGALALHQVFDQVPHVVYLGVVFFGGYRMSDEMTRLRGKQFVGMIGDLFSAIGKRGK